MMSENQTTQMRLENIQRKQKFTGKVVKITLAGAVVDIGIGVPGLVHISQLQKEPVKRVEDVVQVGQTVDVWVRRVFPKKGRIELTMIEPLPLEWREIKEGMVVKGKVTRLETYGAFVDIGAEKPGLVHVSEISHEYIRTPHDVLHEGDEVEVKIINFNRRKRQIKLSIKALIEEPAKQAPPEKPQSQNSSEDPQEAEEEPLTAMAIALKQAMEKSKHENVRNNKAQSKNNPVDNEMDEIFSRTLNHKVQTAAK